MAIANMFSIGDHVLSSDDVYGGHFYCVFFIYPEQMAK